MTETATKAVDVVGVYDVDFNQVFPEARPLRASVTEEAVFFKHPLESSATRTDHIIFQQIKIVMSMIMSGENYENVYKQIKQVYRSQTQLIVQTKTDTYEDIYIQGIPHEESPENFDSVIINLMLEETQQAVTVIIFNPESQSDRDTKNRGQQESSTPTDAQGQRGSTLARWFG
jgi:hypothetical protein